MDLSRTSGQRIVLPIVEDELQIEGVLEGTGIARAGPDEPGCGPPLDEVSIAGGHAGPRGGAPRRDPVGGYGERGIALELNQRKGRVDPRRDAVKQARHQAIGVRNPTIRERVIGVRHPDALKERRIAGDVGEEQRAALAAEPQVGDQGDASCRMLTVRITMALRDKPHPLPTGE